MLLQTMLQITPLYILLCTHMQVYPPQKLLEMEDLAKQKIKPKEQDKRKCASCNGGGRCITSKKLPTISVVRTQWENTAGEATWGQIMRICIYKATECGEHNGINILKNHSFGVWIGEHMNGKSVRIQIQSSREETMRAW